MRFLGILGVSVAASIGVLSAACGDDKAGAIVNDDISWFLDCAPNSPSGCGTFSVAHVQEEVDQNFSVSCSQTKTGGLSVTLSDPGFRGDGIKPPRPPGSITIENGSPEGRSCNVTVREKSDFNDVGVQVWTDSCAATGGSCILTGGPSEGWDFVGTIDCPAMTRNGATGSGALFRLEKGSDPDPEGPLRFSVDNCN